MRLALPAASSLTFGAGILAGAGLNLLTTTAIAAPPHVSTATVVVDAVLWILAAAFLFGAAQPIRQGEREADQEISGRLTPDERQEIRRVLERRSWRRAGRPLVLSVVALAGALALLPALIG
jgi:hypothetical protein